MTKKKAEEEKQEEVMQPLLPPGEDASEEEWQAWADKNRANKYAAINAAAKKD
jgi:hypothetical protein